MTLEEALKLRGGEIDIERRVREEVESYRCDGPFCGGRFALAFELWSESDGEPFLCSTCRLEAARAAVLVETGYVG